MKFIETEAAPKKVDFEISIAGVDYGYAASTSYLKIDYNVLCDYYSSTGGKGQENPDAMFIMSRWFNYLDGNVFSEGQCEQFVDMIFSGACVAPDYEDPRGSTFSVKVTIY